MPHGRLLLRVRTDLKKQQADAEQHCEDRVRAEQQRVNEARDAKEKEADHASSLERELRCGRGRWPREEEREEVRRTEESKCGRGKGTKGGKPRHLSSMRLEKGGWCW